MPGKRITRHQESLYMSKRRLGQSQETAAAKAAISERSGRRIEKGKRQSIPEERHWRTREDPLKVIWEKELVPLLEQEAQLTGLTLWEYLEDEHAGQFPYKVLRTLHRRHVLCAKTWIRSLPSNVLDVNLFFEHCREGDSGSEDLPSPFTEAAVYLDHRSCPDAAECP